MTWQQISANSAYPSQKSCPSHPLFCPVPSCQTDYREFSFFFNITADRNNQPKGIITAPTLKTFQFHLVKWHSLASNAHPLFVTWSSNHMWSPWRVLSAWSISMEVFISQYKRQSSWFMWSWRPGQKHYIEYTHESTVWTLLLFCSSSTVCICLVVRNHLVTMSDLVGPTNDLCVCVHQVFVQPRSFAGPASYVILSFLLSSTVTSYSLSFYTEMQALWFISSQV